MNDQTAIQHQPFLMVGLFIYLCFRMMPYSIREYFENKITEWVFNENSDSYIIIPYHIKKYACYGSSNLIEKILYSNRFSAVNYYIKKHHINKLSCLTEIINFSNTKYAEDNSDFVLLPKHTKKISICEKENIMFEILIEEKKQDDETSEKSKEKMVHTKKYIYKLSKSGKNSIHSLNMFLERIVNEYLDEVVNTKSQTVFEYKKTIKDDDDTTSILFNETPFKSNKSFENLFFEGKSEFIKDISKFSKTNENRDSIIAEYKRNGIPYKGVYLLYGEPGCGKSSLIKASVNYLQRNCIVVEWTKIKTCNDFISLFRPIKINNKTYDSSEFVIVFEDFDANNSNAVKIREGLKRDYYKKQHQGKDSDSDITEDLHMYSLKTPANGINDESDGEIDFSMQHGSGTGNINRNNTNVEKNGILNIENENRWKKNFELIAKEMSMIKIEDELTLECILNVLDGIIELYDVVVFFTTNDIHVIDPALKRKGRIDNIIKMEKASHTCIRDMLIHRFQLSDISIYSEKIDKLPEYKIAYSDICQICNNSTTVEECFQKMETLETLANL